MPPTARAPYVLDGGALRLAGALARPLALWPSAIGRSFLTSAVALGARASAAVEDDGEPDDDEASLLGDVALVSIRGPLAQRGELQMCGYVDGYDWVTARVAAALDAARAVVLVIDSPGGDGAGILEAVRRMRAMADDAGKPVYAYVDELAASAAYWIAAGVADKIFVPEMGAVGSIGAIAVHADESGANEKAGVKVTVFRSPEGKAAGTSVEPLGDTGRMRIERSVDELASRFTEEMSARRGISVTTIRKLDADVLTGAAAVAAGLADGVSTLEETILAARAAADERENEMKLKAALAALIGAPAGASDDELAASASAAIPLVALGRKGLALTGTTDPEAAHGVLAAWKDSHAEIATVRRELTELRATHVKDERISLLRGAVAGRKMKPSEAWATPPVDGEEPTPKTWFSAMTIEALRSYIAEKTPDVEAASAKTPDASLGPVLVVQLTSGEEEDARRYGISVEAMLDQKRRNASQEGLLR